MSDIPPTSEVASEQTVQPEPVPAQDVPPPEPPKPENEVHNWTKRHFGFTYLTKWLQGSVYAVEQNLNVSGWYGESFYQDLNGLMNMIETPAQRDEVLAKIQHLTK